MTYSKQYLERIYKFSSNHKESVKKSTKAGCFYCRKIFNSKDITEFTFGDSCAICPYCSVDSILDNIKVPNLSKQLLDAMRKHWFKAVVPSSKIEKMINRNKKKGKS